MKVMAGIDLVIYVIYEARVENRDLLILVIPIGLWCIKKLPKFIKITVTILVVIYLAFLGVFSGPKHEFLISISELRKNLTIDYIDFYHLDGYLYSERKELLSEIDECTTWMFDEGEVGYHLSMSNQRLFLEQYQLGITITPDIENSSFSWLIENLDHIVETPRYHLLVEVGKSLDGWLYCYRLDEYDVLISFHHTVKFFKEDAFEEMILKMIDDSYDINLQSRMSKTSFSFGL